MTRGDNPFTVPEGAQSLVTGVFVHRFRRASAEAIPPLTSITGPSFPINIPLIR